MMKRIKVFIILFAGALSCIKAKSQNVSINVLTQKSGIVHKGDSVFFEVTINNTDAVSLVGVYKIKAMVSVADSVVAIRNTGHNLPTGWQILSNNKNVITLSNGKDIIAPNDSRTLLIALEGKNTGGPVSIIGQVSFSNGMAPGNEPGSSKEDNPADNFSTSSCTVIK